MKTGIFGSGSWGAALASVLHGNGHEVFLWSNTTEEAEKIARTRRLLHKLPDFILPEAIQITADETSAVADAQLLVVAVPSKFIRQFAREIAQKFSGNSPIIVNATKGIEADSLKTMSEVLEEELKDTISGVVALSGPSHAEEVAKKLPTAIVSACSDSKHAEFVQDAFQTPFFRVYTNSDRKGVETGAALKNVIAIAVGISDGLGFGDNTRAALISRGLVELQRAGSALGANGETFYGLSGLGDLVVTCTSRHSRNRKFGELLAKGYSTETAEEEIGMVVEGMTAVKAVPNIAQKAGSELPIMQEVYDIAIGNATPREAVERLMQRESKAE